jgi:hypothetical protein
MAFADFRAIPKFGGRIDAFTPSPQRSASRE